MPGISTVLLVFLVASPQQNASQQKDPSYDLWLVGSQTLTDELVKDGANLDAWQRSILFGRLAQAWWRENPERAKAWIVAAIESVESVPNKENADPHAT